MEDAQALRHWGIKGMRWGVRKSEPLSVEQKKQEIVSIGRKLDKMNVNKVMQGLGYRGYEAQKIYDRTMKRDPNFSYKKLSKEDKAKYDSRIGRRAIARLMLYGAVDSAVIGGVGYGFYKYGSRPGASFSGLPRSASLNTKFAKDVALSFAIFTATTSIKRMSEINAVVASQKFDALQARRSELLKETGTKVDEYYNGNRPK